jgi:hypothetical protein
MTSTTAPATQHRCQRPGCHGLLRSEASIARGMSVLCDRKVRQAVAAETEAGGFSADQQAKALAAIRSGEATVIAQGLYAVRSSKGDGTEYATDGSSCSCPAGARSHPYRCWHLLVARVLDILFAAAPAATPVPGADWAELDRLTGAFMTAA